MALRKPMERQGLGRWIGRRVDGGAFGIGVWKVAWVERRMQKYRTRLWVALLVHKRRRGASGDAADAALGGYNGHGP